MLVKLGEIWVDPTEVIFITPNASGVGISVKEDGYIGALTVASANSLEEAKVMRDEFASIINAALNTQSFGGEEMPDVEDKTA